MSNEILDQFNKNCSLGLNNQKQASILESISEQYTEIAEKLNDFYKKPQLIKERVAFSKHKVLSELGNSLTEFELAFSRRGGKVIWAQYAAEAIQEIRKIFDREKEYNYVKSNSLLADELALRSSLESFQIKGFETELNSFLNQLNKKYPRPKEFPVLEENFDSAVHLFREKLSLSEGNTEMIVDFIKKQLINKCSQTKISISGANFLVADQGAIAICEEEGNIGMATSFADTHIVLASIDKLIPSMGDLEHFLSLLSTSTVGKDMLWSTQLIMGPRQANEVDGPKKVYLILIDDGRSEILRHIHQRRVMSCIHCGACKAVCPVYKLIGDEPYSHSYSGPIGSITAPLKEDPEKGAHLAYACTMCGKCTEVCPVKIPLHHLILQTREYLVKKQIYVNLDKGKMKQLKKMMMKRKQAESSLANFALKNTYKKRFGSRKEFPNIGQNSFHFRWVRDHGESED